jgi:putative SOS response-associated peptidase YedK
MCYSNSSTSTNVQLAAKYVKKIPFNLTENQVFFASGFTFPVWRIITKNDEIIPMQWGLIPNWFQDSDFQKIASMTLNAKVETAEEKPSFKKLVGSKHCIVPSSGFFEWQHQGKEKIPYFIYPANGIFSMAGLFDEWVHPISGEIKRTFTILTCEANELMSQIHNTKKRMPVLLNQKDENNWLNGQMNLSKLTSPASNEMMGAHRISKSIISGKNPNCSSIQIPEDQIDGFQASLF